MLSFKCLILPLILTNYTIAIHKELHHDSHQFLHWDSSSNRILLLYMMSFDCNTVYLYIENLRNLL